MSTKADAERLLAQLVALLSAFEEELKREDREQAREHARRLQEAIEELAEVDSDLARVIEAKQRLSVLLLSGEEGLSVAEGDLLGAAVPPEIEAEVAELRKLVRAEGERLAQFARLERRLAEVMQLVGPDVAKWLAEAGLVVPSAGSSSLQSTVGSSTEGAEQPEPEPEAAPASSAIGVPEVPPQEVLRAKFQLLEQLRKALEDEQAEYLDNPLVQEARAIQALIELCREGGLREEVIDDLRVFWACQSGPLLDRIRESEAQANGVLRALFLIQEVIWGSLKDKVQGGLKELGLRSVPLQAATFALMWYLKRTLPRLQREIDLGNLEAAAEVVASLKKNDWFPDTRELFEILIRWAKDAIKDAVEAAGELALRKAATKLIAKLVGTSAAGAAAIFFVLQDLYYLIRAFVDGLDVEEALARWNEEMIKLVEYARERLPETSMTPGVNETTARWGGFPSNAVLRIRAVLVCFQPDEDGPGTWTRTELHLLDRNGAPSAVLEHSTHGPSGSTIIRLVLPDETDGRYCYVHGTAELVVDGEVLHRSGSFVAAMR